MNRYAKIFIQWWILLAVIYTVVVIGITTISGLAQMWSFGMSGDHAPFSQNRLFFPTQLIVAMPDQPENKPIFGHALFSGMFYSAIATAVIILSIYEKK